MSLTFLSSYDFDTVRRCDGVLVEGPVGGAATGKDGGVSSLSSCGGVSDMRPVLRAIVGGFFLNAAGFSKGGYRTLRTGMAVKVHPTSTMLAHDPPPRVIVYHIRSLA